ncbi:flagellar basal-body rod protein FlgC [Granulicella rosea]|uniref:Flagellar basal-body rod protein FlgC n=1 Tax=Granulicella rosea TaxID=474952 RepID=A0A239ELM5_9BACT|nr:flagellar basal body rod protein FlgC [Granulicella rosea]SNS44812.1 flagellar basal-body rod protein FlgC [Granulicella rosea]
MNLFGVMDISASALKAERVRAEVVASNMANAETTRTEDGGPYQRHHVVFEAQEGSFGASLLSQGSSMVGSDGTPGGVAVSSVLQDGADPLRRYDPTHPDAGADGYVAYPDINPLTEMVDLMGATRSYGANASAIQAEKSMIASSLDLLK